MKPILFTTGNSIAAVWGPFQRGTKIRGIRFETAPDSAADLGFGVAIFASREAETQSSYQTNGKSLLDTRKGEGDPLATLARVPVGSAWIPLNFIVRNCPYIGVVTIDLAGATGDVDGIISIDCDQSEEI